MQHHLLSLFSPSLIFIKHVHVHANLLNNFHKYLLFAYMQIYIVQMDIHIHTHTYIRHGTYTLMQMFCAFTHVYMYPSTFEDRIWLSQFCRTHRIFLV